jgi:hypothetical protein
MPELLALALDQGEAPGRVLASSEHTIH